MAYVFRTRIITKILAISVSCHERIIANEFTSTVPVEIPAVNARIIAEISIPLVAILMRNRAVIGTGSVEVEGLIFITFVATKIFVTRGNSVKRTITRRPASIIPHEIRIT